MSNLNNPEQLNQVGDVQFAYLESQLVSFGFKREAVIALLESQEKKGQPVKSVENALELILPGDNGYRHDYMKSKALLNNETECIICGGQPLEHQSYA